MWTAKRLGLEEEREPVWNYLVPKKNKISERSYFRMGSDIAQQNNNDDNKKTVKESSLCAWHRAKRLTCILLLNPHITIMR